jgi:hypothetical protein
MINLINLINLMINFLMINFFYLMINLTDTTGLRNRSKVGRVILIPVFILEGVEKVPTDKAGHGKVPSFSYGVFAGGGTVGGVEDSMNGGAGSARDAEDGSDDGAVPVSVVGVFTSAKSSNELN